MIRCCLLPLILNKEPSFRFHEITKNKKCLICLIYHQGVNVESGIVIRQTPTHALQDCLLKSDVQMEHLAKENTTLTGGMPHLLAMCFFHILKACSS